MNDQMKRMREGIKKKERDIKLTSKGNKSIQRPLSLLNLHLRLASRRSLGTFPTQTDGRGRAKSAARRGSATGNGELKASILASRTLMREESGKTADDVLGEEFEDLLRAQPGDERKELLVPVRVRHRHCRGWDWMGIIC